MLKDLKEKDFNINIFGENGCGKTKFIKEIFDELYTEPIYLTYSHFINIQDLFNLFIDHIKYHITELQLGPDLENLMISAININKFSDLQEILSDLESFERYIVIDGLTDIQSFMNFKKQFLKLFAISEISQKRIKIILVSNFDIKQSEFARSADLSTFISTCFPNIRKDMSTLKQIISNNINLDKYQYNVEEVINKSLLNLTNSVTNLNELVYCVSENLEEFSTRMPNDQFLQANYNDLVTCFNSLEIIRKINGNDNRDIENEEEREKLNDSNIQLVDKKRSQFMMPHLNKNVKLNDKLYQQICATPIHLIHLGKESNANSVSASTNTSRLNILPSTKNLTESLSKTQKILLLSSFMAGEISPRMDSVIFINVKKVKTRVRKFENLSLKTKLSHTFNIHRLLAIFSSLKTIIDGNDSTIDSNIELISDVNTLIHLNLIRYVNITEYNFLARKMCSNIGLDFAKKIAEDFEIRLDDFLGAGSF